MKTETMARLISIMAIVGIASSMYVFAQELYSDKYDDIDVINILINDTLRNQHYKCYMSLGPCITADMKFYKTIISEATVTKCKKCTEKQKQNLGKIVEWYTTNKPDEWNEFMKKAASDLKERNGEQ